MSRFKGASTSTARPDPKIGHECDVTSPQNKILKHVAAKKRRQRDEKSN